MTAASADQGRGGNAPPIPAELESVALVSVNTFAAAGEVSVGWVYAEVRAGRAPQPVIRAPRCTRWLLSDVAEFWRRRAEASAENAEAAAVVQNRARKASAAAGARRALSGTPPQGSYL